MKKLLIFLITCFVYYSANSQTIDGRFNGEPSTQIIYLSYYPDFMGYKSEKIINDSSYIQNGRFYFKFKVGKVPKFANLFQTKRNKETGREEYLGSIRIFLANDSIVIYTNDSLKNAKVLNSSVNYDAAILDKMVNGTIQNLIDYENIKNIENKEIPFEILTSPSHSSYERQLSNSYKKAIAEQYNKFIKENPYSWISLYAFIKNIRLDGNSFTSESVQLYNGLGKKLKRSEYGIDLSKRIEAKNKVRSGAQAPLFQLKDTSGTIVNLADYRGKYVLLEFWASWCGPCRFEAPNLKAAYSKYKESGFEILSISLDDEHLKSSGRKAWLEAIRQDGTGLWKQVSALKGFNSLVPIMYDIGSIPQNYLIDPTGKIIAENLRGADLHDMLEDIFFK